jgi:hypothetical protein
MRVPLGDDVNLSAIIAVIFWAALNIGSTSKPRREESAPAELDAQYAVNWRVDTRDLASPVRKLSCQYGLLLRGIHPSGAGRVARALWRGSTRFRARLWL